MSEYGKGKIQKWQRENPEAAHEALVKGGQKAGENKRKKRLLKEYLSALLECADENNMTYYDKITLSLVLKACEGDARSYEIIRDTLGQRPKDEVELNSGNTIKINISGE